MHNMNRRFSLGTLIVIAALSVAALLATSALAQKTEQLTGNWVVRTPNNDGTFRTTYLNLKQEGSRITGTIRVTQFFYHITASTGDADGFTVTGSMMDGKTERKVQYEGKLVGVELQISTRRRPTDNPTQMVSVPRPAKARYLLAIRFLLCTKFPTTVSRARRPWAGTAGTNSRVGLMTQPCAVSRTRWRQTE